MNSLIRFLATVSRSTFCPLSFRSSPTIEPDVSATSMMSTPSLSTSRLTAPPWGRARATMTRNSAASRSPGGIQRNAAWRPPLAVRARPTEGKRIRSCRRPSRAA